jgi:hypothetical protein
MLKVSEILIELVAEALRWLRLTFRSSQSIQAENLFLRRQLALYIERGVKPRRIDPATRIALTLLSQLFDWRGALTDACAICHQLRAFSSPIGGLSIQRLKMRTDAHTESAWRN